MNYQLNYQLSTNPTASIFAAIMNTPIANSFDGLTRLRAVCDGITGADDRARRNRELFGDCAQSRQSLEVSIWAAEEEQ